MTSRASHINIQTDGHPLRLDGTVKYGETITGVFKHPGKTDFEEFIEDTLRGWTGEQNDDICLNNLSEKPLRPMCTNPTESKLYYTALYRLALPAGFFPKVVMRMPTTMAVPADLPPSWTVKKIDVIVVPDDYESLFATSSDDSGGERDPRDPRDSDLTESDSEDEGNSGSAVAPVIARPQSGKAKAATKTKRKKDAFICSSEDDDSETESEDDDSETESEEYDDSETESEDESDFDDPLACAGDGGDDGNDDYDDYYSDDELPGEMWRDPAGGGFLIMSSDMCPDGLQAVRTRKRKREQVPTVPTVPTRYSKRVAARARKKPCLYGQ